MYHLTNSQKELLRWLVQQSRAENLLEEFWVFWAMGGGAGIAGLRDQQGAIPIITKNGLEVLVINNLLYASGSPESSSDRTYSLTGKAYEAVDSDFNAPDTSFVKHLTPLADITNLDLQIKNRCSPILGAGSADPMLWDSAVRTAGVILEERLRDVGGITNHSRVGRDLVNDVFGSSGTLASKFTVSGERDGYRELYAGVIGAIRNPSAHRFIDPSPEEGGATIVFINLLLKRLEDLRQF